MADQLSAALGRVVDALREAGIAASTDARNLHGPAAWVTPNTVVPRLGGNLDVTAAVYLIGPNVGGRSSIAQIGQLLDKVADVLTFDEPAQYVTVTPPGNAPAEQPAMRIITTTD